MKPMRYTTIELGPVRWDWTRDMVFAVLPSLHRWFPFYPRHALYTGVKIAREDTLLAYAQGRALIQRGLIHHDWNVRDLAISATVFSATSPRYAREALEILVQLVEDNEDRIYSRALHVMTYLAEKYPELKPRVLGLLVELQGEDERGELAWSYAETLRRMAHG